MNKQRNTVSVLFMLFSILFCVCLIAANLFATKQIALGSISLTGGLLIFLYPTLSTTAFAKSGAIARHVC